MHGKSNTLVNPLFRVTSPLPLSFRPGPRSMVRASLRVSSDGAFSGPRLRRYQDTGPGVAASARRPPLPVSPGRASVPFDCNTRCAVVGAVIRYWCCCCCGLAALRSRLSRNPIFATTSIFLAARCTTYKPQSTSHSVLVLYEEATVT